VPEPNELSEKLQPEVVANPEPGGLRRQPCSFLSPRSLSLL